MCTQPSLNALKILPGGTSSSQASVYPYKLKVYKSKSKRLDQNSLKSFDFLHFQIAMILEHLLFISSWKK